MWTRDPCDCNENNDGRSGDRLSDIEQRSRASVACSLGTLQERLDTAVRRPEAHGSRARRRDRPACALRPRRVPSPVGRFRSRVVGANPRVARHRAEEPFHGDRGPCLPRSQVRRARHRCLRRGHARYARGRREPSGRSLHGGRDWRMGPDRLDAHSRLRARSDVQQGAAALRAGLPRRRAAARGSRGDLTGRCARAHAGHGARHSRRDPPDPRRSAQARSDALDRHASAARPAVHVHVGGAAALCHRVGWNHRDHGALALG